MSSAASQITSQVTPRTAPGTAPQPTTPQAAPRTAQAASRTAQATPQISLIVPTYNQLEWLPRCFASIDAQTFRNFEVVLVDDGSTDGSAAAFDNYAAVHANARVLHHAQCQGLSAARNTGIAAAQGQWLAFLDSDDWLEPAFLESLHAAATAEEGVQVAQVGYKLCSEEGALDQPQATSIRVLSGREAAADMLRADEYAVWCRMYDAALVRSLGDAPFPVGLTCEDRVFNMQLLPRATKVAQSNRVEYHYFLNVGSLSLGGLTKRGLDLLEADNRMVAAAQETGDAQLVELALDRQAKGAYSLLVKHARYGITDSALEGQQGQAVVQQLQQRFQQDYPRLMKSQLGAGKRAVAWELAHAPWALRAEFALFNKLGGTR